MYFATVDWLTTIPTFRSSPWIRGAPQRGFASDIVRIGVRMSAGVLGRPVRRRMSEALAHAIVTATGAIRMRNQNQ
jgi:hypothetical protein